MAEIDLIARRLVGLDERVVKIESLENGVWKLNEDMERSEREYLARRGAKPRRAKP